MSDSADAEIARRREQELARQRYELELERARRQAEFEHQRRMAEAVARQKAERARQEQEAIEARIRGVTGSGFFVTDVGHVATNLHVVADFPRLRVRLQDGRLLDARKVLVDSDHDLALLRVDMRLPGLKIAPLDALVKGEHVFTVGYPVPGIQGQESKVTDGIVNSLSASLSRQDWFQFSAEIQPGNSGGPVVNEFGEVIGIAVAQADALKYLSGVGSLPQNVNYAVKASFLNEMLRYADAKPSNRPRSKVGVIKFVDAATVMIVADDPHAADRLASRSQNDRAQEEAWVEQAHPGWKTLINTADFQAWFQSQPDDLKRLANSPRASDAILVLTLYKRDKGVR